MGLAPNRDHYVFRSAPIFWRKNLKDNPSLEIQDVLQGWSNLHGVGCDGVLNGLSFPGSTAITFRAAWEEIDEVNYLVVRNCSGTIVWRVASDAL